MPSNSCSASRKIEMKIYRRILRYDDDDDDDDRE